MWGVGSKRAPTIRRLPRPRGTAAPSTWLQPGWISAMLLKTVTPPGTKGHVPAARRHHDRRPGVRLLRRVEGLSGGGGSRCRSAPACQRLPVLASFHWRCWPDCPGNTEHLCSHARRPAAAQRALRVKGDLEGGQVRATPEEGVRPAVVREADHALLSRGDQGHGVGGQSMFAAWTMIQGGAGGSMAVCVAVAACRAVVREADHALQMIRAIMLEDSLYLLHGL